MQCLEQDVDPAEEAELRRLEGGAGAAEEASEDESEQVDQGGEEEADAAVPVTLLEVRLPPPYPEDGSSTHRLRIQASNIVQNMNDMKGVKTYKTTWSTYYKWHCAATGQPPPTCPFTGLMWLDARQGTHFLTDMASKGMTTPQMSSARSALNWLITQHHTMQSQIHAELLPAAKLSSKDAVREKGGGCSGAEGSGGMVAVVW